MIHDYEYNSLLKDIYMDGVDSDDRTGVGTRSIFGGRMEFDISESFPLLTGKRLSWKSIAWELFWFMEGRTNNNWLKERGVSIWDEWADQNGNLGPIYGFNWRSFGGKIESIPQPKPISAGGYCGVGDGNGSENHPLKKRWQGIIQRCYSQDDIGYSQYGGRGVYVCNRWLVFKNFAEDCVNLPGYDESILGSLNLDKDIIGNGFCYSPDTCCWVTASQNQNAKSTKTYIVEKDGIRYEFKNPSEFCESQGISNKNFSDLWTGNKNAKVRDGFRLVEVIDTSTGTDQLSNVIEGLRKDPHGRRHIVNAWDASRLPYMALPPCHMMYQFYSRDGWLDCQMYQRSCDMFLGVPYNIASYSLLTYIVAHITGLKPRRFIWIGGDCHIYRNHFDQVMTQLRREYRHSPTLTLVDPPNGLEGWTPDNCVINDYNPHPAIKAPVAV